MRRYIGPTLLLLLIGLSDIGCSNVANEYNSLVERELATNVRHDTLLMDLRFGMDKPEFFTHCWELHKKGIVREGSGSTSVYFEVKRNDKSYEVNFYPRFNQDKIISLPVEYNYAAFAPWNPNYSLDLLLKEVLQMYQEEYGDDFIAIKSKTESHGISYVRVDGNRRISIYKNINTNRVIVYYFDMLVAKDRNLIHDNKG